MNPRTVTPAEAREMLDAMVAHAAHSVVTAMEFERTGVIDLAATVASEPERIDAAVEAERAAIVTRTRGDAEHLETLAAASMEHIDDMVDALASMTAERDAALRQCEELTRALTMLRAAVREADEAAQHVAAATVAGRVGRPYAPAEVAAVIARQDAACAALRALAGEVPRG